MSLSSTCGQFELGHHSTITSRKLPQLERLLALPKLTGVLPASRLEARHDLEMRHDLEIVSSGIRELDLLTGGLPRGCLTEVCGPASSGRTSLLLSVLAASTRRDEVCAMVDVSDALDPMSAHAAGINFEKLLWVRCGRSSPRKSFAANNNYVGGEEHSERQMENPVEQALRVTDLLLQSGGFGLVVIDLGDVPVKVACRIPLTSWFRFQRVMENTPTVLLVVAPVPCAPACASLLLKLRAAGKNSVLSSQLSAEYQAVPSHSLLLHGLQVEGELLRSRKERKPMQSITRFDTRAVWAG